ncbi:hypothetical protein Q5752_000881 [Cryptotrichosporon argae]
MPNSIDEHNAHAPDPGRDCDTDSADRSSVALDRLPGVADSTTRAPTSFCSPTTRAYSAIIFGSSRSIAISLLISPSVTGDLTQSPIRLNAPKRAVYEYLVRVHEMPETITRLHGDQQDALSIPLALELLEICRFMQSDRLLAEYEAHVLRLVREAPWPSFQVASASTTSTSPEWPSAVFGC